MSSEPIFHCSLLSDWEAAQTSGEYRISSRGLTLEQEGFIHACYAHQVDGVLRRYYADVTDPMVLLRIDPDRLTVPVVPESPPGVDEQFPHIYGPLPVAAVSEARPLSPPTSADMSHPQVQQAEEPAFGSSGCPGVL